MIFLSFLFLVSMYTSIFADEFTFSGDSSQNQFYQTVAYTVDEFPKSVKQAKGLLYDVYSVRADNTTDFLNNQNISNLTSSEYMVRIPGVGTNISAPVNTKVDIIYYYFNNTGHSVEITDILIPYALDSSNAFKSSLMNILDVDARNQSVSTVFNGNTLYREGLFKKYSGIGVVEDKSRGSFVIDSVYISNPLEIKSIQVWKDEDMLRLKVLIKNNSNRKLSSISFEHLQYGINFNILAYEEKTVEYVLAYNGGDEVHLGYFEIYNPDSYTQCSMLGSDPYDWLNINSVSVFANRSDGGWITGAYLQPCQYDFCITRIPYTMMSENIVYLENTEEQSSIIDTDSSVQGISDIEDFVLPKTGKIKYWVYIVLVVDIYLWYSFSRKVRKYESKNENSKICKKSSTYAN